MILSALIFLDKNYKNYIFPKNILTSYLIYANCFPAIFLFSIQTLVYLKGQFWDQYFLIFVQQIWNIVYQTIYLRYAGKSTIYQHCRAKDLKTHFINTGKDLSNLLNWSSNSNLVFNATKTKLMLLITSKMKVYHKWNKINNLEIKCMKK